MSLEAASNGLDVGSATKSAIFLCEFCYIELSTLSLAQREIHYERHLTNDTADPPEALGSRSAPIDVETMPNFFDALKMPPVQPSAKGAPPKKKKLTLAKETDTFWYSDLVTPPPRSHVPGLIYVLRKGLMKGHNRGSVRRAALCVDNAVLIHREAWDASWGCGYRNFLMACATLMSQMQQPTYFPLLDSPIPPSVRNLQQWIEMAWDEGFDAEGQKDLKKLIGSRKWIGTADIWVAFVSRGIPALLVDFDLKGKSQDALINWVVEYFTPKGSQDRTLNAFDTLNGSHSVINTQKMPLILQHDGHSRTVVGYEVNHKGVTNLLVFDPAYSPDGKTRRVALAEFTGSKSSPLASGSAATTGSPSVLKRKRSADFSSPQSPARNLPSVQNNLCRTGLGHKTDPDFCELVKHFRLEPKKLEKKKQYQILYFPMTAPLSANERMQRKQVTSIKIS